MKKTLISSVIIILIIVVVIIINNKLSNKHKNENNNIETNQILEEGNETMNIKIIIGNDSYTATLIENDTTKGFLEILPIELEYKFIMNMI